MSGKNIKRDEKGHSILPGAKTFGHKISTSRAKQSKANEYKSQAASRLVKLLTIKPRPPKQIDDRQAKHIERHNEIASAPKVVKIAYYYEGLKELRAELDVLLDSKNERKIAFAKPTIEKQIKEVESIIKDIYMDIKMNGRD